MVQLMRRETVLELGAIALACLVGWAAFAIIDAPPMTRAEVADWAQGLGSIAAVGVAAWAGTLPLIAEKRRLNRVRNDFLDAVEHACRYATTLTKQASDPIALRDPVALHGALAYLPQVNPLAAMDKLLSEPLSSWPSIPLYSAVFLLRNGVQEILEHKPPPVLPLYAPGAHPFWQHADLNVSHVETTHERVTSAIARIRSRAEQ